MNMTRSTFRSRRAVAVLVALPALLVLASPAGAVTGPGAFGERVNVTIDLPLLVPDVVVTSGPTPEVHAPAEGTATDSLASVLAPPILSTGVLNVQSSQAFSKASVDELAALGATLTATAVSAECTGPLGRTDLVNASLNGVAVTAQPAPNTVLVDLGGLKITLNRQFTTVGGDFVVRAVDIELTDFLFGGGLATGEIVVSEARCNTSTQVPAGAIGAVGVAGLVAVLFAGQQVVSRRRRSASVPATV